MGDNNNKPFFSIVIPAYNAEKYLEECVESINSQTYKDFEIVIVDDGSTDNTPALCDALPGKFPRLRIKVRHQENKGQLEARMTAISLSEGAYLMFIDSDDKLTSNALEVVKGAIDQWNADITMFNAIQFWEGGSKQFLSYYTDEPFYMVGEDYKKFLRDALPMGRFGYIWLKAYRRQVIMDAKRIKDDSIIRLCEDWLMQLPWFDKARSAVYIPENLYLYRLNPESMSFSYYRYEGNPLKVALLIYDKLVEYGKKWGLEYEESVFKNIFIHKAGHVANYIYERRHELSYREKKALLTELMNNKVFRKEIKGYRGSNKEGPLKMLILRLLYLRLWRTALFVIEHDPKLDRKRMARSHTGQKPAHSLMRIWQS